MNTEDQELLEIEKMLETMKDMEPTPELRGETLSKARHSWQHSSNFSSLQFFKWAAAAILIFSIGYFAGLSNDSKENSQSQELDAAGNPIPNVIKDSQQNKVKDKVKKSEKK